MKRGVILGFDIGGTKTGLVLGDDQGQILRRAEIVTPARIPFEPALDQIFTAGRTFLDENRELDLPDPQVISVSVGGPLDIARGMLHSPPHLAAWGEAPLKARLEDHFRMPVHVEHDGNAGALAEFTFGAGRGTTNMIFLTMGTGLGAGLILDGKIYHGSSDMAGEVGHIRMAPDGPVQYGKAGSWEGFSSGAGLVSLAHWLQPGRWQPDVTTRQIVARALEGDLQARELISAAGNWLGRGIAVLVDILNPDRIVVGTLGVVLGDLLLEPARVALYQEALLRSAQACAVVPAQLGSQLGDTASLMAAISAMPQKT